MGRLNGGDSCAMYLTTHSVSAVSSIPSKGVSKWKVARSEFTLSCRALARARVIGPLGGLGGFDAGASVGRPTSGPSPWERVVLDSCGSISSLPWYGERSARL